jgi:hypothetical protein
MDQTKSKLGANIMLPSSCFYGIYVLTFCQILLTASILEFEDKEKQKRYETISFRKIQDEVKELKVPCK